MNLKRIKKRPTVRTYLLGGASALFTGAEAIVPLFSEAMPKGVFGVVAFVVAAVALVLHMITGVD